jgi:hypothetical protein
MSAMTTIDTRIGQPYRRRAFRSRRSITAGASRNGADAQSSSRSLCSTLPRLPRSPASTR